MSLSLPEFLVICLTFASLYFKLSVKVIYCILRSRRVRRHTFYLSLPSSHYWPLHFDCLNVWTNISEEDGRFSWCRRVSISYGRLFMDGRWRMVFDFVSCKLLISLILWMKQFQQYYLHAVRTEGWSVWREDWQNIEGKKVLRVITVRLSLGFHYQFRGSFGTV